MNRNERDDPVIWPRSRKKEIGGEADEDLPQDPHPVGMYQEILEGISEGVLLLDKSLKAAFMNAAAQRLLGLQPGALPRGLPSDELISLAQRATKGAPAEETLKLWFPGPRTLKVRAMALSSGGVLMSMNDVTEEFLAQRIRREFVTHASHELKSPVASIQTLAGAIGQAIEDDQDAAARFSGRLVKEAERLGRLINDLLDLSRLEERGRSSEQPVDLSDAARRAVDELQAQARSKNIELLSKIGEGICVRGEGQQLSLLLRNLLDNAVRYTSPGGTIQLDVESEHETAVIRVTDNGMGIPLEAQGRIFERFYRVDKARSRERGGTGLGLAIVKHVAELHGGGVDVQSEVGRGSVFTARLPLSRHQEEARESA